ncbi:hypothetical protein [Amycolatopsis granulosa]|uniref:hypothetical protein n=1 Tax=Amycolatopsis granulosa TaxID=185684 RepID=UPI00141E509C|nr:hypothetical protein [Amycolatopsis granulosa]NIH85953.1 hypothetical protein [Amycolatopsis granulosa]
MLAQCVPVDELVLYDQAVADWFIVLAHARNRQHRHGRGDRRLRIRDWLRAIQEHIALASGGTACPTCSH